ncbi:hypothetical protein [Streptomyces silvisoli]|uniref:DUF4254 domain-containing protein n=1 Tax=Streptomyces silvisoli TaxID=3034235 RepID=A0ABT5ZQ20_9ACTN|nr:hypothetical protein [Streptomyces silvisoli]MDF3291892.1 hypothetical protein [Streptomyces silvisoli]
MIHTPREDARALSAMAHEVDTLRQSLPVAEDLDGSLDLVCASHQLAALNSLVTWLSDEVLSRVADRRPVSDDRRRAVAAFCSATTDAGQAAAEFAGVYEQLGFFYSVAGYHDSADLRDVRWHATTVAEDHLSATHNALQSAADTLHLTSVHLNSDAGPRATAARSSTTTSTRIAASEALSSYPPAAVHIAASGASRPAR